MSKCEQFTVKREDLAVTLNNIAEKKLEVDAILHFPDNMVVIVASPVQEFDRGA